jgi:DNA-binding transcriptional MerR regulator
MATAPAAAPAAPASPAPVKDLTPAPAAPAVAAPAAPITPTSALDPGAPPAAPATPAAPTQTWPEDWRDQLVGNDEKLLKRMQRYASPRDVANALIAAQNRISSGELRSALKANATPEEVAAWRAENGIPDAPEKYDLKMPNGIVFGEEDKAPIESFLKSAHAANFHPDQVKAALAWYHQDREAQVEQRAASDAQQREEVRDELIADWGANEFGANSKLIMGVLDMAPEGVKETMLAARGPDERALFNNAGVLRFFDSIRRIVNPTATVVPTGQQSATYVPERMQTLQKMMGDHRSEYWKGPKAASLQAEYRKLVDEKNRQKAA